MVNFARTNNSINIFSIPTYSRLSTSFQRFKMAAASELTANTLEDLSFKRKQLLSELSFYSGGSANSSKQEYRNSKSNSRSSLDHDTLRFSVLPGQFGSRNNSKNLTSSLSSSSVSKDTATKKLPMIQSNSQDDIYEADVNIFSDNFQQSIQFNAMFQAQFEEELKKSYKRADNAQDIRDTISESISETEMEKKNAKGKKRLKGLKKKMNILNIMKPSRRKSA